MVSFIYSLIKAIPAIRDIFVKIQDMYYNDIFEKMSDNKNSYKEKRRALSNAIETANSNDDLRALSIMLAELQLSAGRGENIRKTKTPSISPK